MVADHVDDQIELLSAFGVILFRVVKDVIGTERQDHRHIASAVDSGYVSAHRFRNLHGERADAAG